MGAAFVATTTPKRSILARPLNVVMRTPPPPMLTLVDTPVVVGERPTKVSPGTIGLAGFSLLLFSGVVTFTQGALNQPCLAGSELCSEKHRLFVEFFANHELLAFALITTHAIPYVLFPYIMRLIADKGEMIMNDHPEFNPFVLTLAMATTAFGLSLEVGWHVYDSWFYDNDFHPLNFGFYFFLISSFALWADAFKDELKWDLGFAGILLFATVLYPIGAAQEVGTLPAWFPFTLPDPAISKIPLYLGLTVNFLVMTLRGREVFGNKMWTVFALSVGVNLFFIFLLAGVAYEEGQPLSELNYLYHIGHDFLGTEAGVFYFSTLISGYEPKTNNLVGED